MKTRKTFLFFAQDWLSKAKKGTLTIDIPLFKDGKETISTTDYKLIIKTSDISGAGKIIQFNYENQRFQIQNTKKELMQMFMLQFLVKMVIQEK
jgi:hypothetical protein